MPISDAGSRSDWLAIVTASLAHLTRLTGDDGRFVYAHPFGAPDIPLAGYNMLRHCGTLWFMLRALNSLDMAPGTATLHAIERATRHAGSKLARPDWIAQPSLALVTRKAVKTGGIGLALVMLAEYRRAQSLSLSPDVMPLPLDDTIAALQAYAMAQLDGDDFVHKRSFADGTVLPFRSDYYTGEVLLGLFTTGCRDPRLPVAASALLRRGYGIAEQSHWMAYAACEALETAATGEEETGHYLTGLVTAILTDTAYRARREATPVACRSEALSRILLLAEGRPTLLAPDLIAAARHALAENLALQLKWYGDGQFRKGDRDGKVQIDYIQHNATAFLNALLLAPD